MNAIDCNGVRYSSVLKFAKAEGISYNVVYKQLQMGMSPEDIVAAKNLGFIAKTAADEVPTVYKTACEYNGKRYKNLVEASADLGLKLAQIYAVKSRRRFTASETIAFLMREKNGEAPPRKPRGKNDAEAQAAAPARSTGTERKPPLPAVKPAFSVSRAAKWNSFSPEENASRWQRSFLEAFASSRLLGETDAASFYKLDAFPVLHFPMAIGSREKQPECWVVLNEAHVEMYITGLHLRAFTQSLGTPYEILNQMNADYGVRIWMPHGGEGSRELRMGCSLLRGGEEIPPVLVSRTLLNLIGTCEELVRKYD